MMNLLLSSPQEEYTRHIQRAKDQFELIYPVFKSNLARVLCYDDMQDALSMMIIFHDLGKLTAKWQERVGNNFKLPAHAPIGAAYLWNTLPEGLREPVSFAVAIHHSDKGLLGDNIEKPDVQAIDDGIVDYSTNKIKWDERVDKLKDEYFSQEIKKLGIVELKSMARGLRVWSKGCGLLEQHTRRIQASLIHHILKLCDISAASEREELKKQPDNPFGGWLMVKEIQEYMNNIEARNRARELQIELKRCLEILKDKYAPIKVLIFGSIVGGNINKWSDIDMIIIKETQKRFLERTKEVLLLLRPKIGMDILVYRPSEFDILCKSRLFFKSEILSKGEVIYERGS
jgi:CRISPR-associated endonuclease Cas3-HD